VSAMKIDHARAMPSRSIIRCDHAATSANGGTASLKLFRKAVASGPSSGIADPAPIRSRP
jgi:hypothetical protein